jgi:UDP-2,3-diacylglucosamine pyrophosphatase LpxH
MAQDKDMTWRKLSALWADEQVRTLEAKGQKFALLSDLHLGNGGEADDFYDNREALLNALEHYLYKGFTLILLGDVEELWQFDLEVIEEAYSNSIYAKMREFGDERVYRIFGNHDREWGGLRDPIKTAKSCAALADEAIKIKDTQGRVTFLLVHGHQGSLDSDKLAWISRFLVRIYTGLEPILKFTGMFRAGSMTKSSVARDFERTLYLWAKSHQAIIICGHSHRAIFASEPYSEMLRKRIAELRVENTRRGLPRPQRVRNQQEIEQLEAQLRDEELKGRVIDPLEIGKQPTPCYFNTGCCLYTDGATAIEIEDNVIRLVKWSNSSLSGPPRQIFDEGKISDLMKLN